MFLADSPGLDFLNTLAVPVDIEVDWLSNGDDLLAWLQSVALVDAQTLAGIRAAANPGELDAVAAQARALREWFRDFVGRHRGHALTRAAIAELEPLNRVLARDEAFGQVVAHTPDESGAAASVLAFVGQRRWRSPEALLLPIAQAIAQLVANADFTDVKHCEGPACVLHFLDTTRGRRRRWCSMAACGNRAKQAAHRDRHALR